MAAGIMIAGVATLPRMHADILPETSPVVVDVQIEALGLSAPEVEQLVTVPMEKNFFEGVMGVTDETSQSIPGLADIELHFAPGTNLYQARQLVQERLNSAFLLPNVSSPPTMIQPTSTTSDVELVGLTISSQDLINLSVLSRWTIVPKLLGLDGVANVSTYGQSDRQLQVLVDPAKMAARGVALSDVLSTVGDSQLVTPISYLQGSTPGTGGYIEGSSQRLDIRHILPNGTPSNLAGLPIVGQAGESIAKGTTVGSVATVQVGHQPLIGNAEVNGRPGLVLVIQKLPGASVTGITSEVQQALASLHLSTDGVTATTTLFTQGTYATSAHSDLKAAAILAAVLAVIALLLLLLSLRGAFVAFVSVGVSLTLALLALYLLGQTINALLLLGLLLAAGVTVADATAAAAGGGAGGYLRGMGAGLLVVLLAGIPLVVSSGTTANFLRPMALAFMVAAAASFLVSATVATALAGLLERVGPNSAPAPVAAFRERLAGGYRRSLRGVAKTGPGLVMAGACVAIGAVVLAGIPFLHPGQPTFQDRNLIVAWTAAPGTSLTEMDRLADVATGELQAIPGVQDVGATLGRALTSNTIVATNSGELWVTMRPDANYGATLAAIKAVADDTPGITGTVSTYESDAMGAVLAAPPNEVVTRLFGTDYATLEGLATRAQALMAGVPGVSGTQVQYQTQAPTIDVQVNLDAANKYNIAPGDIRREAATLIEGLTVGNFFESDEVFDVTVQAVPDVRATVADISNLEIDTAPGQHVRLGQVASVKIASEQTDIQHEDTFLYLDVTANVSGRSAAAVASDISGRLSSLSLPQEYSARVLSGAALDASTQSGAAPGDTVVPGTSFLAFLAYIMAALLGIFLVGHAALGKWKLGLVAFGSLPVAMGGAMLVVYAAHWTGSLGAVAGLLATFGLAARQAITVTAQIRDGHADVHAAAARTAGQAITVAGVTGVAMLPFALSGGTAGLELLWPAACVILGGLVTITLVSLYVLPVACLRLGPELGTPGADAIEDETVVPPQRQPADAAPSEASAGAGVAAGGTDPAVLAVTPGPAVTPVPDVTPAPGQPDLAPLPRWGASATAVSDPVTRPAPAGTASTHAAPIDAAPADAAPAEPAPADPAVQSAVQPAGQGTLGATSESL